MKKNKLLKIVMIVIIILLSFINIINVNANTKTYIKEEKNIYSKSRLTGIEIDTSGLTGIYGEQDASFNAKVEKILGIVSYICYASAFIVLVYKGVQFMNKAPEAKAELKKELINVAIGAFILVAIGGIIQLISNIAIGPLFG